MTEPTDPLTSDGGQPPPSGDPIVAAPLPHLPKPVAFAQIERFLTGKAPIHVRQVPWPVDREHILEFVRERLEESSLSPLAASRLPILAEAYLLEELPAEVLPRLRREEAGADDVWVSASLCAAIGRVGTREEIAAATDYYEGLVASPHAAEVLAELLPARDALGPVASSGSLRTAIEQRSEELIAEGSYESEVEGQDLDEIGANGLQDIDWADQARERFSALDDEAARLPFLLEVYLERADYGGEEVLTPWAVREIRKCAHRGGAEPVIAALESELAATRETRDADPDASFASVRLLRAIEFFGGDLREEERDFLEEHQEDQKDPLSLEIMMPEHDFSWMTGEA